MAEPTTRGENMEDISPVAEVKKTSSPNLPSTTSPSISFTEKDDNYEVYQQYRGAEFAPQEAKRVLRKVDVQILPLLIVIYTLQYLDKNSINFAEVYGLEAGTNLHGQDYSWLSK
jgi:hypothetical protein